MVLLAKKYLQKWKHNAWKLGVMRRGRKQRQSLARSMQDLAWKTHQKQEEMSKASFVDKVSTRKAREKTAANGADIMPPPAIPKDKRQSLPSNFRADIDGANQTPKGSKRKLDDVDLGNKSERQQTHPSSHKRSNTVGFTINGHSTMSAPPHRLSRVRHGHSTENSKFGDGTILSNTVMKHARRMVPETRSDTTQTDYFRLKALGIDPDTPSVPWTSKRNASSDKANGASVALGRNVQADLQAPGPVKQSASQSASQIGASNITDDDEDFFASIRAIRSTLADSTSWFQSERESIERSMTPSQASASPPSGRQETAAERRLREIKERGHTPTRSEIRLRAMGDKALLPEGFWNGEGMGRSRLDGHQAKINSKRLTKRQGKPNGQQCHQTSGPVVDPAGLAALAGHQSVPKSHAQGFSALAHKTPQTAIVNGWGPHDSVHDQQLQHGAATSEEVIELSD